METLEEAIKLIENMVASDHDILRDQAYTPTKKSPLEFTSQDAMLAQNKLLAKTLEILITTLSNLPQQLHVVHPSPSAVMHIRGCNIFGGAYELGLCMAQDDASNEVKYMANQNRQGFHQGGPPGYHRGGNFSQGQG